MKKDLYSGVFGWMFIGLLVTFLTGFGAMFSETLLKLLFSGFGYIIVIVAQIILCIFLSVRLHKMSPMLAKICYLLYTALTGLTFSSIFMIFQFDSIILIFLVTAIIFGLFALLGKTMDLDLSKFAIYFLIALLSIIVLEVINIFLLNNTIDMIACILGIIVFVFYVAYDMQNVKKLYNAGVTDENVAIMGAFQLYLDFINLFVRLLSLFGKSND